MIHFLAILLWVAARRNNRDFEGEYSTFFGRGDEDLSEGARRSLKESEGNLIS